MEQKLKDGEYIGYKFLTGEMTSPFDGTKWEIGEWRTQEIDEKDRNGKACGVGLHLMINPIPIYTPYVIGFMAIGRGLLGQDEDMMRFESVKLVRQLEFSEIFYPGADLTGADLFGARLVRTDLTGTHGLGSVESLSSLQKKQIHC